MTSCIAQNSDKTRKRLHHKARRAHCFVKKILKRHVVVSIKLIPAFYRFLNGKIYFAQKNRTRSCKNKKLNSPLLASLLLFRSCAAVPSLVASPAIQTGRRKEGRKGKEFPLEPKRVLLFLIFTVHKERRIFQQRFTTTKNWLHGCIQFAYV